MSFLSDWFGDAEHLATDAYDWTTGELSSVYKWTDTEVGKLAGWTTAEVKGVGREVFSFVTKGIGAVEHIYDNAVSTLHHVVHDLRDTVDVVGGWAGSAVKWIEQAPELISHYVDTGIAAFERDVVQPIAHGAASVVDEAEHYAATAVDELRKTAEHELRVAVTPLEHWVGNADHWFAAEFSSAWGQVEHDVLDPIVATVDQAATDAANAVDWITKEGIGALELVVEAADWLAWMAVHSISDIEAVIATVSGGLTVGNLEGVVAERGPVTSAVDGFAQQLFRDGTP